MRRLLWKLLGKQISKMQLAGFAIANIIGLAIVMIGVQFYADVVPLFSDDGVMGRDYLVVTKKVSGFSALKGFVGGNSGSAFTKDDLNDLKSQDWVASVGTFTTSNYPIYGSVELQGRGLRTSFFFESVPDEFIDVDTKKWTFDPNNPQIPIIVSKDYLSLYNFGFAASQGMPQLSEGMVGMVPIVFRMTLPGGGFEYIPGKIVGFSSRLNTIIVPDAFMKWSNERYAPGISESPSRIIVKVKGLGNTKVESYFSNKGYEVAGDKLNNSKASGLLSLIMSVVVVVGLVICFLSFLILVLSIYLLMQKNTEKLKNLLILGYSPKQVAGMFVKLVLFMNAAVFIIAVFILTIARMAYLPVAKVLDLEGASICWSLAAGLLVIAAISCGNVLAIRKKIRCLWIWEK